MTNGSGGHGSGNIIGDIFLALIAGGLFGLVSGMGIIHYGFNSDKVLQNKILQWKKDNPTDPRGKYL